MKLNWDPNQTKIGVSIDNEWFNQSFDHETPEYSAKNKLNYYLINTDQQKEAKRNLTKNINR